MPAGFTRSFVQRLDALCAVRVYEAEHGQRVLPGHAYIAPGGNAHMKLARSGANYVIHLEHSEPVNRHRPSVDVLFYSAAKVAGKNAVGRSEEHTSELQSRGHLVSRLLLATIKASHV